jgi:hypothetical protein
MHIELTDPTTGTSMGSVHWTFPPEVPPPNPGMEVDRQVDTFAIF